MSFRGLGALLTTEVEYTDLGEYGGRRLRGRVERRILRLGAAPHSRFQFTLVRARPTAVEVWSPSEADTRPEAAGAFAEGAFVEGAIASVPIPAPVSPFARLAQGAVLLALAAWLLPRLLARLRHTRH